MKETEKEEEKEMEMGSSDPENGEAEDKKDTATKEKNGKAAPKGKAATNGKAASKEKSPANRKAAEKGGAGTKETEVAKGKTPVKGKAPSKGKTAASGRRSTRLNKKTKAKIEGRRRVFEETVDVDKMPLHCDQCDKVFDTMEKRDMHRVNEHFKLIGVIDVLSGFCFNNLFPPFSSFFMAHSLSVLLFVLSPPSQHLLSLNLPMSPPSSLISPPTCVVPLTSR